MYSKSHIPEERWGTEYDGLMHVTDWLPTIAGAAEIELVGGYVCSQPNLHSSAVPCLYTTRSLRRGNLYLCACLGGVDRYLSLTVP